MLFLKYLIMGIIQGITEPLPVSSSGHLVLLKSLIDLDTSGMTLELLLHFGSLIAILIFYFNDIKKLFIDFFQYLFGKKTKSNQNSFFYILKLIVATIPAGIIGILFKDKIEIVMSKPLFVGIALIITSIIIYIACTFNGHKTDDEITYKDALFIGLFQAIALLPGISRSGSTICGGIINNVKRENAMKFSFMLFIPIAVLSILSEITELAALDYSIYALPIFAAMLSSFVITYIILHLVKKLLVNNKYRYFSYYCFIVGLIAILFIR